MSAGAWWPEAMVGLGAQLLQLPLLPWRLLGAGMEAIAESLAPAGGQPHGAVAPPMGLRPHGAWPAPAGDGQWTIEPWRAAGEGDGCAATHAAPAWPSTRTDLTGGAAGGGAAVWISESQGKEDRTMTCCCDQNLSGCELKIVSYSVVSVDPEIDSDEARIILPSHTIATSSDMTPADFTAYVIASQRGENRERLERYDPEYLRVCFWVICRYPVPCVNYEKEQAQALRAINRALRDKDHGHHIPASSSSQELAPAEPKKGGRP